MKLLVRVRRETDDAWGVANEKQTLVWLPKSQVKLGKIKYPEKTTQLTIRKALAREKGLT